MRWSAARASWITVALRVVGGALFTAAGVVAVFWRPLWGAPSHDLSGVVATAAGAIAFTGTIFTAIALPMTVSGALPGGLSTVVLRRPLPWVTGVITVLVTAGLFVLASSKPTSSGAVFASLITGSVFALVWVASRSLLETGDHYQYARRQARFMRAQTHRMRSTLRRGFTLRLRKHLRTPATVSALIDAPDRQLVHGMIRQLREAVRYYCAQARAAEAVEVYSAIIAITRDYATDRAGAIGPSDQVPQTLLSTLDEVIVADMRGARDQIAVACLNELVALATSEIDHFEFNALKAMLLAQLSTWLERLWDNDDSDMPYVLAKTIGDLTVHAIQVSDSDGTLEGTDELGRLAQRCEQAAKTHISLAACGVPKHGSTGLTCGSRCCGFILVDQATKHSPTTYGSTAWLSGRVIR